jgi:uncharacterized protein DUF5615
MTAIKIYFDEDVHTFIAHALRLRGWDILTTQEAQRREADDREQITFAGERGYAILSYNVRDFPRLHYELVANSQMHAGIIVATQDHPHRNLRAVFRLLNTLSAEVLRGQLVYLNNWT